MSSSGLIYAVIVGAWAAYLVPMWLRRQDELNEARPTERFSTAIRLLSGKAAMERRYAKDAERRESQDPDAPGSGAADGSAGSGDDDADTRDPDEAADDAVDVRAFAEPRTMIGQSVEVHTEPRAQPPTDDRGSHADHGGVDRGGADRADAERLSADRASAERNKRARVLARRRRTTMLLFAAFTIGAIVAAVGGLAFLWAPAAPAALLSAYIVHLRAQERRRFAFTMDRRRAEEAAQRLRERGPRIPAPVRERAPEPLSGSRPAVRPAAVPVPDSAADADSAHVPVPSPTPAPVAVPSADRRALVEQTDHAEWVDQERGRVREQQEGEGWDPVPVPLPTYVSAPVAPRTARGVDLDAPDTWSSARSSTAGAATDAPPADPQPGPPRPAATPARERARTPLFDQYADDDRPRAANE